MKLNKRLASFMLVIVFLFLLVPSGIADSVKSVKPVKVNIGNEELGGSNNIAGSELELYNGDLDFTKPPIETWTTGEGCKTLKLNPGIYTLKEKTPPTGYEPAEPIVFKIDDEKVYVEDDDDSWTPQYPEKRPDETDKYFGYYYRYNPYQEPMMFVYPEGFRTEKDKHHVVYCFNQLKEGTPAGPADGKNEWRHYVKLEDATRWSELAETPRAENEEEFEQNILRVILNGYPRNKSNLQKGMSNEDFYEATQIAVWYYTDSIPLERWRHSDFYNFAKKTEVVDMAEKLVGSKVPNNMKDSTLNIYLPRGDNPNKYQSLIGTDTVKKDLTKEYSITIFNKKRPEKQTIKIGKIDKNHYVIPGADFEVYDLTTNKLVEKWTSDKGPHYKYLYLHPGEYLVRETKAPDGYIPVDDFTIVVGEDGSAKIKHQESWDDIREWKHGEIAVVNYQEKEKVWLTIGKVTGSKQNPSTISGAEMRITNIHGEVIHQWRTNKYEYIQVVPGIYYIEELKAPYGGYKPIKPVKFSIDKEGHIKILEKEEVTDEVDSLWRITSEGEWVNDDKYQNNTIRVYNHKETDEKVIMRIGKLDKMVSPGTTYHTLAGATFEILDPKTKKPIKFDYSENYYNFIGSWGWVERWEWTTERAKNYNAIRLYPGEYILHEKKAPEGFVPVSDIRFRIYAGGTIEIVEKDERDQVEIHWPGGKSGNELKIVDEKHPKNGFEVTFEKIGEYTREPIAGALLQILDESGNRIIKEWTSEEKTESFKLDYGTYIFREIYAPTGYREVRDIKFKVNQYGELEIIKKENPRDEVEITNEYEGEFLNKKTTLSKMTVTDKRKDYNFYVRKDDSKNGRFLADAEFALYWMNPETERWEHLRTDKTSRSNNMSYRGLIYYNNYMPGTYKLQETKAPPGYNIRKEPIIFHLKDDGSLDIPGIRDSEIKAYECGTILIPNERGARLPDAGGDGNTGKIVLAGIVLLTVGLSLSLFREKTEEEKGQTR